MRRALDGAKSRLEGLSDRDAILTVFFEHAATLFQFCVLFVVRGEGAHGCKVHGIGAPAGLVSRLAFPFSEPGILQRARDGRRGFFVAGQMTEADARLFGSLGRALPEGLVIPLVVRDRVVAILLGDGSAEAIQRRAVEAGRNKMELVGDEMLVWTAAVGATLERLILSRKGSMPPPGPLPPMVGGFALPIPRPPLTPGMHPSVQPASPIVVTRLPQEPSFAEPIAEPATSKTAIGVLVVAVLFAAAGVGGWWLLRGERESDRIALAGAKLPGWPSAVDPSEALAAVRAATAGGGDLATIEAHVAKSGKVDFSAKTKQESGVRFVFMTEDAETEARIDGSGVHSPRRQPRSRCGEKLCLTSVPPPTCAFAQIREAAMGVGLRDDDTPLITYLDGTSFGGSGGTGPEWSVEVRGRGRARLAGDTCKPMPRERLLPPPFPIAKIPGAPKEVDPLAVLALAREQSGLESDAVLLEIDARGVASNGTVDLTARDAAIVYTFSDPANARPRRWREVTLGREGMPVSSLENDTLPVPVRFWGKIAPMPLCTFSQAYKTVASSVGGATIHIVYAPESTASQIGEFKIEIPGGASRRLADAECTTWDKAFRK